MCYHIGQFESYAIPEDASTQRNGEPRQRRRAFWRVSATLSERATVNTTGAVT